MPYKKGHSIQLLALQYIQEHKNHEICLYKIDKPLSQCLYDRAKLRDKYVNTQEVYNALEI